jgi:hypothetical protein
MTTLKFGQFLSSFTKINKNILSQSACHFDCSSKTWHFKHYFRYDEWRNNKTTTHLNITVGQWLWYQWPALVLSSFFTFFIKLADEKMAKHFADKRGMKRRVKVNYQFTFTLQFERYLAWTNFELNLKNDFQILVSKFKKSKLELIQTNLSELKRYSVLIQLRKIHSTLINICAYVHKM